MKNKSKINCFYFFTLLLYNSFTQKSIPFGNFFKRSIFYCKNCTLDKPYFILYNNCNFQYMLYTFCYCILSKIFYNRTCKSPKNIPFIFIKRLYKEYASYATCSLHTKLNRRMLDRRYVGRRRRRNTLYTPLFLTRKAGFCRYPHRFQGRLRRFRQRAVP